MCKQSGDDEVEVTGTVVHSVHFRQKFLPTHDELSVLVWVVVLGPCVLVLVGVGDWLGCVVGSGTGAGIVSYMSINSQSSQSLQ